VKASFSAALVCLLTVPRDSNQGEGDESEKQEQAATNRESSMQGTQ